MDVMFVSYKHFQKTSTVPQAEKEHKERQMWLISAAARHLCNQFDFVYDGGKAQLQPLLQPLTESSFTFPLHKQIPRFT